MELIIKNGRVISPADGLNGRADIHIKDGRIEQIGDNIQAEGAMVIDAEGLAVFPGLVDMHAHFREPGFEYKEDILSARAPRQQEGILPYAACLILSRQRIALR